MLFSSASDWMDNLTWYGKITIVKNFRFGCRLEFHDELGKKYAFAFLNKYPSEQVQTVQDSSRFFMIKVQKSKGNRNQQGNLSFTTI